MFVTIVSVRTFVSCLVDLEKKVKRYGNLMTLVIFVIFNRGVPCLKNFQWTSNFGNILFLRCINRISPSVCKIRNLMKKQAFSAHPSMHPLFGTWDTSLILYCWKEITDGGLRLLLECLTNLIVNDWRG